LSPASPRHCLQPPRLYRHLLQPRRRLGRVVKNCSEEEGKLLDSKLSVQTLDQQEAYLGNPHDHMKCKHKKFGCTCASVCSSLSGTAGGGVFSAPVSPATTPTSGTVRCRLPAWRCPLLLAAGPSSAATAAGDGAARLRPAAFSFLTATAAGSSRKRVGLLTMRAGQATSLGPANARSEPTPAASGAVATTGCGSMVTMSSGSPACSIPAAASSPGPSSSLPASYRRRRRSCHLDTRTGCDAAGAASGIACIGALAEPA
jgi:hypothetical protein